MRVIEKVVNFARRAVGSAGAKEIQQVRIFEDERGFHFQTLDGTVTWGNFATYATAKEVAEKYNCYKVIGNEKFRKDIGMC